MRSLKGTILLGMVVLAGCAHSQMRGTVAMKVGEREAHICMGNKEVKEGDRVGFFVNRCQGGGSKLAETGWCELVKLGEGKVVRLLDEHYSVVQANVGVKLAEGILVERL